MIGDPPNMMIASASGFSFDDFLIHLLPIALGAILLTLGTLAIVFRSELKTKPRDFGPILAIDETVIIKDEKALKNVILSLAVVLVLFLLQKSHGFHHALIALIGAGTVLALVRPNIEEVLKDIEWPILVFFGSLFKL